MSGPPPPPPPPMAMGPPVKKFEVGKSKPKTTSGSLMDEIRNGPQLRKAQVAPKPASSNPQDDLMAAIKNRVSGNNSGLNKFDRPIQKKEESAREPMFQLRKTNNSAKLGIPEKTEERKLPEFMLARQALRGGSVTSESSPSASPVKKFVPTTSRVGSITSPASPVSSVSNATTQNSTPPSNTPSVTSAVSTPPRRLVPVTLPAPTSPLKNVDQPLKQSLQKDVIKDEPTKAPVPALTPAPQPTPAPVPINTPKVEDVKEVEQVADQSQSEEQVEEIPAPEPEPEPVKDDEEEEVEQEQDDSEDPDDVDDKAQEAITAFSSAQKQSQQKNYSAAIDLYNTAVSATKDVSALREIYAKSLFMRAQAKKSNQDIDGAIKDFTDAIQSAKKVDSIKIHQYYNSRANAYNTLDKLDEAIKDYNKVIKLLPDDESNKSLLFAVYYNRGVANSGSKRYTPAIDDFKKSLSYLDDEEVIEKGVDPIYQLARCHHFRNEVDEAIQQYQRVSRIDSQYLYTSYHLGHLLYNQGRYDEAMHSFASAIEKNPDDVISMFNKGMCNKFLGNKEDAIEDFKGAISIQPKFLQSHLALVNTLPAGDSSIVSVLDGAINVVDDDSDPELASGLYFERGLLQSRNEKHQDAVQDFTSAIKLNPTMIDSIFNRGLLYNRQLGQYEQALSDFDTVLNIDPNDDGALTERGLLFLKLNHLDKALSDFERLQRIEGQEETAQGLIDYVKKEMQSN
ncbi:hypothetical protein AKO1_007558 [Acrasis kona]|uniref:WH2 domain-containing protein n=1 Tax=Acrasis kona TaxID=1008807 RepID=A0AAW2YQW4_9EUKA